MLRSLIYRLCFPFDGFFSVFSSRGFMFSERSSCCAESGGHRWTLQSQRLEFTNYIIRELSQNIFFLGQVDWPQTVRLAYFPLPSSAKRQIDETPNITAGYSHRPRHGARRRPSTVTGAPPPTAGVIPTSGVANRVNRTKWNSTGPEPWLGALADSSRRRKNIKFFSVKFDQWAQLLQQGSATRFTAATCNPCFDSYLREEVVPFIWSNCSQRALPSQQWALPLARTTPRTASSSTRMSSSAAFAMSGVYDLRNFMDGMVRRQFLFQQSRRLSLERQRSLVLPANRYLWTFTSRRAPARGENSGPTYHLSEVLSSKGIRHSLDNWGPQRRARLARTGNTRCANTSRTFFERKTASWKRCLAHADTSMIS